MTIVSFASIKGAPGVTTLACLIGATWPEQRQVVLVEADPSGGDLAARFHLSSRDGWPAFNASARRTGVDLNFETHLQQLPGGLDVLVGTRGLESDSATGSMEALLSCVATPVDRARDVLVDLGRLIPGGSMGWIEHSDCVVVCTRGDAASLVQVRERASIVLGRCRGKVSLAIVGPRSYPKAEIEGFTGIPVIGEYPFDPAAAAVVAGEESGGRRLHRSALVSATTTMGSVLARGSTDSGGRTLTSEVEQNGRDTNEGTAQRLRYRGPAAWSMLRPRNLGARSSSISPSPLEEARN